MSRQIKIHKSRMAAVTATFLATIAALSNLPSYAQWDITTQTRGMPGVAPDAQTSKVDPSHEADAGDSARCFELGEPLQGIPTRHLTVTRHMDVATDSQEDSQRTISSEFTSAYDEYARALDTPVDDSNTRAQVVNLLANSAFNVKVASYLYKRDEKQNVWIQDQEQTLFVINDYVSFDITSEYDGFVYLFYQNAEGKLALLYPSDLKNDQGRIGKRIENFNNNIKRGKEGSIRMPEQGDWLKAAAPYGTEYLFAVVTNYRLNAVELRNLFLTESAAKPKDSSAFATFCQYLRTGDRKLVEYPVTRGMEPPFRYGACRIAMGVFETQAAKDKYLSNPQTYFVGIGIDKYACSAITPLPSCVNDVTRMAETLQAQGAITKNNTLLLTNEDASAERIKFLFSSFLPTRLRPCDRLIVHWSSHGATISDKMCFVPYDAEVSVENEKMSASGMITSDALNQWSYLLTGREIFYIFDCCYSGAAIDKSFNWVDVSMQKSLSGNNIAIMASSSDEEVSLVDRDTKQFSIMSKKAIDYLAANRNVDAQKLFKAIESDVNETANSQFQKEQHVWWASGLKEFIINPDSTAQGQSQAQAQESDAAQTSGQNQQ